jgi:hypothetical protein
MTLTQVLQLQQNVSARTLMITKKSYNSITLESYAPLLQHRDKVVYQGTTYVITGRTYVPEINSMILEAEQFS